MHIIFSSRFATMIRLTLVAALMVIVASADRMTDEEQCVSTCRGSTLLRRLQTPWNTTQVKHQQSTRPARSTDGGRRPSSCPSNGYAPVPPTVGIYKLHDEKRSWPDAEKYCRDEGAHLAAPKNELEVRVLLKWIGDVNTIHLGFYWHAEEYHSESDTGTLVMTEEQKQLLTEESSKGKRCAILTEGDIVFSKCLKKYLFVCQC